MPTLVRDIETRSTVNVADVGAHVYAAHPTTSVLCVGYCVDDEPIKIWHPGEPVPKPFIAAANGAKWDVVAHNAAFEMAIERSILGPRHGFPTIQLDKQVCTMAQGLALALPGALEKVARVLNLKNQKDPVGARLMLKLSKPRKPKKGEDPNGIYYIDDPELLAQLDQYCMHDVAVAREIFQSVPDLIEDERLTWQLDQRINDRGFYLDSKLAEAARKIAEEMNPRINDELTKITNGRVTAFTQVAKINAWVNQHTRVPSLGKAIIEELLKLDLPNHVRRVLELRLLGAQAAVAKVDALLQRRCADGRIRGSFVYHAAGPGRWSSRGAQVHNLKRSLTEDLDHAIEVIGSGNIDLALREYSNPLSVIGDCIRGMIIAKPGHVLIGGDFSGIEARVTAWIAGEESKLDVFRAYDAGTGPDPYIVAAGIIYGIDPFKIADDYKNGDPIAREMRQIGKACELAFGFQGGVNAFYRFAPGGRGPDHGNEFRRRRRDDQPDRPKTFTEAEVEQIKNAWRAAHPKITSFWHAAKNAAERAVENKTPDDPELIRRDCPIRIACDHQPFLWITLPSGRRLSYPKAHNAYTTQRARGVITEGQYGDQEGVVFMDNASGAWRITRVYGGLITENIVQATARDLLRDAMRRIDAAGYEIVLHVHDECVIEVPIKDAKRVKPIFTKLMAQVPDWAEGLPIVVNSWVNKRYTK